MYESDYLNILQMHFSLRAELNPRYSLNAFARDLNLRPSHLSEVFHGKKGLSRATARQITKKLRMGSEEGQWFIDLVVAKSARSATQKTLAQKKINQTLNGKKREIDMQVFCIVKDWYHFALLEYLRVAGRPFNLQHAASFFEMKPEIISQAVDRLKAVGLIKGRGQSYSMGEETIFAPEGVPSQAKKMHHLQLLRKAQRAYLNHDFDQRDFMSSTFAIDKNKIGDAKKLVRKFHRDMNRLLTEPADSVNGVYCFSTQLFSLGKL